MTPETAVAFPAGDEAALADAIESLLADEPRRQQMGAAARALAQERYSWDSIARRLVGIYDGVTSGLAA
jgi:glycosyltransferase involved in cell wall biosynthesis